MTRINCVPVAELTSKHLVTEYRELPRVFGLARSNPDAPKEYTLGKGHVIFFYNKLAFCYKRQCQLVKEMRRRGFTVNFEPTTLLDLHSDKGGRLKRALWNDWEPTQEAMEINRRRIEDRLNGITD
jgi:deoxyribonuclease (pyrimidine dimer)